MEDVNKELARKIANEAAFMSTLKIALPAKGPAHEDATYCDGEFFDSNDIAVHYRKMLSNNMKKEMKRRSKQVEREQKRLGGPIVLWTFKDIKKGRYPMSEANEKKEAKKAEDVEKKAKKKGADEKKEKKVKKEKKGKADKKKGKSNNKKSRGPRVVDGKITLIEKKNPKREKSSAYKRYELYRKHKTIASYLEAGGKRSSLRYDERHGFIKLSGVKTAKDSKE